MKIKSHYLILGIFSLVSFLSCEKDLIDREPLDEISPESFFANSSDLRNYMNGRYEALVRNVSIFRWNALENGSDNWVAATPSSQLMRHNATGQAPQTSSLWNDTYTEIRRINYFLENADKVPEDAISKHYIGEGYYARAYLYYTLLRAYGGVPYIDKTLNTDSEELYTTRSSRDEVATKVIEDLDNAIERLDWKGAGQAGPQRINKQAALVLKTRVGLYEGSWEYYHGQKGDAFAVSGSTGTSFLNEAVEAGDMLIEKEGGNVFTGPAGWEYFNLFNREDLSGVPGAYLYFSYSGVGDFNITNGYFDGISRGSNGGATKSVLDAYLMSDGKPAEISDVVLDELSLASYGVNKDPRLRQTIYTPDRGPYLDFFDSAGGGNIRPGRFTGVSNQSQARYTGSSGIKAWKGQVFESSQWRNGSTDDLILRYAEGLLNYAEAKAILGTLTQTDLDKSVNVLRNRVNMPAMNLGEVNGWSVTYSSKDGYDPGASNVLNEIRRERRVELMLEGFRWDDIKRWALLEEIFNGEKPLGAPAVEISNYWNDSDELANDGWPASLIPSLSMTLGENYNVDPSGDFINPFFNNADFIDGGRGYFVEPGRDYLNGIPQEEIDLYKTKGGVILTQNPGWF